MRWTGVCSGQAGTAGPGKHWPGCWVQEEARRWRSGSAGHRATLAPAPCGGPRRLANRLAKVPELVPTLFPQSPRDLCWSATSVIDESAVNPYNYGNIQRGRTPTTRCNCAFCTPGPWTRWRPENPREEPSAAFTWCGWCTPDALIPAGA
jgi:hypothetical protein